MEPQFVTQEILGLILSAAETGVLWHTAGQRFKVMSRPRLFQPSLGCHGTCWVETGTTIPWPRKMPCAFSHSETDKSRGRYPKARWMRVIIGLYFNMDH